MPRGVVTSRPPVSPFNEPEALSKEKPDTSEGASAAAQRLCELWRSQGSTTSDCMKDSEVLLCRLRHVGQLAGFLSAITAATLHMGGQCTNLWRTGTISYRCRTCQLTSASAICPPCFQAGGHDKHDYVMYVSPSGGCCDCGDPTAWRSDGCCPQHTPLSSSDLGKALTQDERCALSGILQGAFARLAADLTGLQMREATSELVAWLHSLCEVPVIRCIGAQAATTPPTHFDHARPAQEPVPEPSTSASCTPSYMQILSCCIPQGDGSQPQAMPARSRRASIDMAGGRPPLSARVSMPPPEASEDSFAMDLDEPHSPQAAAGASVSAPRTPPRASAGQVMPPQTSPIRMHWGMSMSPQRLSFSSAGAEEGRPIRSFEYSTSLPVGRSGWGQYLRQRGPRSECASSGEKTPLQQVVEAMVYMPKDLLEEVTRLMLVLLYEADFKQAFTHALLGVYGTLTAKTGGEGLHMGAMLDQLVVQLFLSEERTGELVHHSGLLETFLSALNSTLAVAAGEDAAASPFASNATRRRSADHAWKTVKVQHPAIADRLYFRMMADTSLVLSHAVAVEYMFAPIPAQSSQLEAPSSCFEDLLLPAVGRLQGMVSFSRQHGEHVEYEREDWFAAVSIEMECAAQLIQPLLIRLGPQQMKPVTLPLEVRLQALIRGVQGAGRQVMALPMAFPYRRSEMLFSTIWEELLSDARGDARLSTSPHLPLHHLTAALTVVLLSYQDDTEAQQPAVERAISAVLRDASSGRRQSEDFSAGVPDRWTPDWRKIAAASVRQLAWIAQVDSGLWTLNGRTVGRIARFYCFPAWACLGLDNDIPLLQIWAATSSKPYELIMDLLLPFGAAPFIWAAARRTPSGGFASQHAAAALFDRMHPRPEQKHEPGKLISFMRDGQPPGDEDLASVIEEKRLACIVQGLRWLLVILRHCPTQSKQQKVRSQVVHTLAVSEAGHADLQRYAPSTGDGSDSLLDQALEKIAEHITPDVHSKGRYRLISAAWAEFSPHFHHYSLKERDQALHNAKQGGWKPESQLAAPALQLPRALHGTLRLLDSPLLHSLCWSLLRYATLHRGGQSDDMAITAMTLISMACDRAWTPGTPRSLLREELARALTLLLRGHEKLRPGILPMLQEIADCDTSGWEARACASHLVQRANHIIASPAHESSSAGLSRQSSAAASMTEAQLKSEPAPGKPAEEPAQPSAADVRKAKAKARQAAMMVQMKAVQAAFETAADQPSVTAASDHVLSPTVSNVAAEAEGPASEAHECAMCKGDKPNAGPLGWVANMHMCCLPAKALPDDPQLCGNARMTGTAWPHINPHPQRDNAQYPGQSLADGTAGLHVSACGHAVHSTCLQDYLIMLRAKEESHSMYTGVGIIGPWAGEYLCPVCRRLANTLLPIIPQQPPATAKVAADAAPAADEPAVRQSVSEEWTLASMLARAESVIAKPANALSRSSDPGVGTTEQLAPPPRRNAVFASEPATHRGLLGELAAPTQAFLSSAASLMHQHYASIVACASADSEADSAPAAGPYNARAHDLEVTRPPRRGAPATGNAATDTAEDLADDLADDWEDAMRQGEPAEDDSPRRQAGWHAAEAGGQWHHAVALPQQTQEATDPEAGLEQGAVEAPTAHQGDVRHQRVTDQVGQVQAQARRVRQLAAQLRAPGFAAGQDDRARAAAQAPGEQQELEATVEQLMAAADGLEQSVAQISALGSRADAALADAAGMAAAASHSRAAARQPQAARLWAILAHNVVHWEVTHRKSRGSESMAAADAAHWRAMQSIAQLCMRIGIGTDFPSRAFLGTNLATTLRWLAALDRASLALEHAPEAASEQQRAHATLSRVPSVVMSCEPISNISRSFHPIRLVQAPPSAELASADQIAQGDDAAEEHGSQDEAGVLPLGGAAASVQVTDERAVSEEAADQVERSHSGGAASTSRASEAAAGSSWSWASLVADPFLLILQLWATAITANHESSHTPVQALKAIMPCVYLMAAAQAASHEWEPAGSSNGRHVQHLMQHLRSSTDTCDFVTDRLSVTLMSLLRRLCLLLDLAEGASSAASEHVGSLEEQQSALLSRLGLPDTATALEAVAQHPHLLQLLCRWRVCSSSASQGHHPATSQSEDATTASADAAVLDTDNLRLLGREIRNISLLSPSLIDLAPEYQGVYLQLLRRECARCRQVPVDPVLCLSCGQLLCCGDPLCGLGSLGGPAYCHAMQCGAGIGVFLMVRGTHVLVLRGVRATMLPPFYLDAHGEEDPHLHRGKALHISKPRLDRVHALWAASAFDFDTRTLHGSSSGATSRHAHAY